MRNLFARLVAFGVILSAGSATAGTEAFNSYKHTNEYGHRETTINVQQDNYTHSVIDSQTIKMEAE